MKKILVLEDDQDMRTLYQKLLESAGYKVYPCATITKALELISQYHPFSLYIVDLVLNESTESGYALIDLGISPALMVTGVELDMNEFPNAKFHYLRKPFKNLELLKIVKEIIK